MSRIGKGFVWHELTTTDCEAAESFYRSVFGWKAEPTGSADRFCTRLSAGEAAVAGMSRIAGNGDGPTLRPSWLSYIAADVDTDTVRVVAAGGSVRRPPEDVPSIGRLAVVADPWGAPFVLFRGTRVQGPASASPNAQGHIGWHGLHAGDGEGAFSFYSELFGWTKGEALDMGPAGVYQTFAVDGIPTGGMMPMAPETPAPYWLFYVNVEALDAAISRVERGGGRAVRGAMPVPMGRWVVHCSDPQGAIFAMLAPRR